MKSTMAASLITTALACSGTDDPAGPRCFEGTAGALGVTETIKVNLEEINAGSGKVSFTGAGVEGFTCSHKGYTHTGLDLELEDVSDCMPSTVSIKKLQYCSDSDEVDASVKVDGVPFAISKALTRVACDGENFESCKGSEDPVVTEPACYQGRGGALGLTETVTVILKDFADSAGHLDFSGDGIIGFTCSGKQLTKSGQDISLEDASDCLPSGVEVSSVKYCSDSDTIKVTVKDTAVPLPVSALLSKVACSAEEVAVEEPLVTGACTSDEQGKLADPKTVGDKANTCGTSSYNIITGNFNHDTFNSCFTAAMGISTACAECYAATGEYGAKNCKADCLLGWCKSGCLSCTEPAQETLATCTGFTAGTADPCEDELREEVAVTGTLKLTWSDCGSKHGTVTSMSPLSFQTGTTATITGTGTIDEDVTSAKITATISALGTQLTSCSGDGTSAIVCNLPLNTGTITVPALPFPLAKGTLNLPVLVKTSSTIPASLASVDIHLTGDDQNGESAICLDAHTEASSLAAAVTGACTSDEQGKLADPKTVGDKANICGTSSYNIITGNFNHDTFNSCFTAAMGISTACAECYAATGEYGAKNCKADCLLGWCKSGCLSCTEPAQETLATCTGFTAGTADPCEEKAQGFLATVTV